MRVKVTLACTECKQRNYNTMKNKKNDPDRIELKKYCKFCKRKLFTKRQNKEKRLWQVKTRQRKMQPRQRKAVA